MAVDRVRHAIDSANGISSEIRDKEWFMPSWWSPPPKPNVVQSNAQQARVLDSMKIVTRK